MTAVHQIYWIPYRRQSIKALLRTYVPCKLVVGKPYPAPDHPPLSNPEGSKLSHLMWPESISPELFVHGDHGRQKLYICLFTCSVSRAVHLEIVSYLTVKCFLQAFCQFSRNSLPQLELSDNISTYVSAAKELKEVLSSLLLADTFSRKGIEWQFFPKQAPWLGGFRERSIGMTKSALINKVFGWAFTTLDSLQTIMVEIEAMLSNHLLTYVSSDIRDSQPLTPAHLIYGQRIVSLPYPVMQGNEPEDPDIDNSSVIQTIATLQATLLQHFWNWWKKEYLTWLIEFHCTMGTNEQPVKPGAVVLVHDDIPCVKWRLAVVEDVIVGEDALI